MDRVELTERAVQMARVAAGYAFGRQPDCEERIADAVSSAWEFAQSAGPEATPGSIVHYAIRRVKSARMHHGSERSIEHPRPRGREPARRFGLQVAADFARVGDDPALIAMANLDVAAWLTTLPPLKRAVARLAAAGYGTQEIARRFRKSEARISQIRSELRESWREFTDG
jgi:DNA-directed RNA polymerase specialized sigma24 family protein